MVKTEPRVQATEMSFKIIDILKKRSGVGVTEISKEVDISKSAVYNHLQTLTRLGYLYQADRNYYLSNQFRKLSSSAENELPVESARRVVTDLAETTGHISNFIAHEYDRGIYILRISPDSLRVRNGVGDTAPLHASAGGKAILAFLSRERRNDILSQLDFEAYTDKTITDRERLEKQLQSVHDRRIAYDREEYAEEYQCVASPVIGGDGEPIGAVSVTGNVPQMSGKRLEEDVVGLVTSAAKSIQNDYLSS